MLGTFYRVSTTDKEIAKDVRPGDRILMDDGLLEVRVLEKNDTDVITEIVIGGLLKSKKGLNLLGVNMSVPSLSEKDIQDVYASGKYPIETVRTMLEIITNVESSENYSLLAKERYALAHHLVWGVQTIYTETLTSTDESFKAIEARLIEHGLVQYGNVLVYTMGIPILKHGTTDTIKVSKVGA